MNIHFYSRFPAKSVELSSLRVFKRKFAEEKTQKINKNLTSILLTNLKGAEARLLVIFI